tara:strand:+ start:479 stop:736 length:258 start_codon:yes stop_codon:yes gene_type:complete
MQKTEIEPLWTAEEVAKFYNISPSTIGDWRKKGRIPYITLINGHFRYDMDMVRAFAERTFTPKPQAGFTPAERSTIEMLRKKVNG